jgi:hypothetical protein
MQYGGGPVLTHGVSLRGIQDTCGSRRQGL